MNIKTIKQAATDLYNAGLNVLPVIIRLKSPGFFDAQGNFNLINWTEYQSKPFSDMSLFERTSGICLITGNISGNLEVIDFDVQGYFYQDFLTKTIQVAQSRGLNNRLKDVLIEKTQSGGFHLAYRLSEPVEKSQSLARLKVKVPDEWAAFNDKYEYCGKEHKIEKDGCIYPVGIETRADRSICVISPTPGYETVSGSWLNLPVLTQEERQLYIDVAKSFDESPKKQEPVQTPRQANKTTYRGESVADQLRANGEAQKILTDNGWKHCSTQGVWDNYTRPGKAYGTSGGIHRETQAFHVFTSNGSPLEQGRTYTPLQLYAAFYTNGDLSAASIEIKKNQPQSYQEEDDFSGLYKFLQNVENKDLKKRAITVSDVDEDPDDEPDESAESDESDEDLEPFEENRPINSELLTCPGFIGDVVEYCRYNAPFFNQTSCFCGALAMQSYLCGRKIQSESGLRSNLYIIALAHSCSGKDYVRKINAHIMYTIGELEALGDSFASGEGLQDSLKYKPCLLIQSDEFDVFLKSIKDSKDGFNNSALSMLLTLYTASSSVMPLRKKAGQGYTGEIIQPHLTLLGTAPPGVYYQSLSDRMLSGGLLSRFMIFDSDQRIWNRVNKPPECVPDHVLDHAAFWANYKPKSCERGNLAGILDNTPDIVGVSDSARDVFGDFGEWSVKMYNDSQNESDEIKMACYGRAYENATKLAMLYVASQYEPKLAISEAAATWGTNLIKELIRRQIAMVDDFCAENEFEEKCKKVLRTLKRFHQRKGRGKTMTNRDLKRFCKFPPKIHDEIINELLDQKKIERSKSDGKTKKFNGFRLL